MGVVISGYVKNYLLRRVCNKRNLIKTDKKTFISMAVFGMISGVLGLALLAIDITNIWVLGLAICGFGIMYLPTAYIIDRRIIK